VSIYGLNHFKYLYIYDKFHGELDYDPSWINVIGIDIEVNTGNKYTATPGKKVKVRKKEKYK